MMIKKYKQYNETLSSDLENKLSDNIKDVKMGILDMIETSLNSSDISVVKEFIDSYLSDETESVIEGLVNDSDIYEFYLKYTESIDLVLTEGSFFDIAPSEHNVIGLYDYMVFGTNRAIKNIVNRIKNEIG